MSWAVCKTCRHHLVLTENTGQTFFTTSKQKPVATAERLKGGQRAEDKLLVEQTGRMNIVCKTALFRAYVTSACTAFCTSCSCCGEVPFFSGGILVCVKNHILSLAQCCKLPNKWDLCRNLPQTAAVSVWSARALHVHIHDFCYWQINPLIILMHH